MATILSKILNYDIAYYIYKIVLDNYLHEKLYIMCFNVPWIIEKHKNTFNENNDYNLIFIINDIKLILNLLNKFNINHIEKYKNYDIKFPNEYKLEIYEWIKLIKKFNINQQIYTEKSINNLLLSIENIIK